MRRSGTNHAQLSLPGIAPPAVIVDGPAPAAQVLLLSAPAVDAAPTEGQPAPWSMTLDEWLSAPREWSGSPRLLSLEEWRSRHRFHNPLDDHGDFSHPNGISNATRRRINARLDERTASMVAGAKAYNAALAAGQVAQVIVKHEILGDGTDTPSQLAAARLHHKHSVMRACRAGLPVPQAVRDQYPSARSAVAAPVRATAAPSALTE